MYDDKVREFVVSTGIENIGRRLVNSKEGKVRHRRNQNFSPCCAPLAKGAL